MVMNSNDLYEDLVYEEPEIGFCVFNLEPVCVGPDYQPFECPKNSDGCKFNLNDANCVEYLEYHHVYNSLGKKIK